MYVCHITVQSCFALCYLSLRGRDGQWVSDIHFETTPALSIRKLGSFFSLYTRWDYADRHLNQAISLRMLTIFRSYITEGWILLLNHSFSSREIYCLLIATENIYGNVLDAHRFWWNLYSFLDDTFSKSLDYSIYVAAHVIENGNSCVKTKFPQNNT